MVFRISTNIPEIAGQFFFISDLKKHKDGEITFILSGDGRIIKRKLRLLSGIYERKNFDWCIV